MILQRYMGSHLEDLLENEWLKASKVTEFNDPFEFHFHSSKQITKKDIKKFTQNPSTESQRGAQSKFNSNRKEKDLNKEVRPLIELERNKATSKIHDIFTKKYAVICFFLENTDKDTEILMWSHYSNNHYGFRISFRFDEKDEPSKVDYSSSNKKPSIKLLDHNHRTKSENEKFISTVIKTKSKCWEYENEYRIIQPTKDYISHEKMYFFKLKLKTLTRIDFGIRYDERNDGKEERGEKIADPTPIPELIKKHLPKLSSEIVFTQAKCNPKKYKIDYHEIDKKKTIEKGEVVYTGKIL